MNTKPDVTTLTAQECARYYEQNIGGLSDRSAYLYTRDVNRFVDWVGHYVPIIDVTPGDIKSFLYSGNPEYGVVRRRYYALRSFYRTLGLHGFIEGVTVPGQTSFSSAPVPANHLARLLRVETNAYTTSGGTVGIREKVIVNLAYSLLSPTETAALLVSDVDLNFGVIFHDGRMTPLSASARDVFGSWLARRRQRGPDPHFITTVNGLGVDVETIRQSTNAYCDRVAGVPYTFRNFHASRYLDDIASIGDTARLARLWGLNPTSVEAIKLELGEY
jgi:site-specific recombinase XerD